jgi:NAD(P)-dependent dehydrogenase (short-subunit alcohol dehydrogenase family)
MENTARVAIVTGGAHGIGRAAALRLAQAGRDIVIADRDPAGEAVAATITALGRQARAIPTDVTDAAAVQALVDATLASFGRLDMLVAAAGVLGQERPFLDQPDEEWRRVLNINLHGSYHACRAALPPMLAQGWGRIVLFSSAARHGAAGFTPYAVSKGGVVALMRSLANAYAAQGVLVNCVEPGRTLTDMVVPRFSADHLAHPPGVAIGRYAEAAEVATVINYLCAEENTYTVGAIWRVGGSAG